MSAPIRKLAVNVIPQTASKAVGSVIFLHGSGDTGPGVQDWVNSALGVPQLQFPHLRLLFPTAPPRPYTPMMGGLSTVWYNRQQISPNAHDDESVDVSASLLSELINSETKEHGIPVSKIIVGGFSMGGGMALQLAFRYHRDLAGVFGMSCFLGKPSLVYQALQTDKSATPPLFMSHGEADELVLYRWGTETHKQLSSLGVASEFHSVPNEMHSLDRDTLTKLSAWINRLIPCDSSL